MSYKNKTAKKIECPIYLGSEYRCPIMGKICEYEKRAIDCLGYQQHFIREDEKRKIEKRSLDKIVEAFGLKKLSKNNGKFKK